MALTPKREAFTVEYLKDFNATQAAIRAGYSVRTACSQGERLLRNVDIQAAIQAHRDAAASEAIMTFEEACRRLTNIGRADLSDYIDENGNVDWKELRQSNPQAVASVEHVTMGDGAALRKFRLHNPVPAIERLARMQGWDAPDKHEITTPPDYEQVRERFDKLVERRAAELAAERARDGG